METHDHGTITRITAQRRNRERVNVFVDGGFKCGAAYEAVASERLIVGSVVSADMIARLAAADDRWKAKQSALSLLGVRMRSRGELGDRLRKKGFADDAIAYGIAEADRIGLIDDRAFAEAWVRDRLKLRPRGMRALVAELGRKRIPAEAARDAVTRVMTAERLEEDELCMAAAVKWARTRGRAEMDVVRTQRRLQGFLARRGFGGDAVRKAVRAAMVR